jgi:hypothetical protein
VVIVGDPELAHCISEEPTFTKKVAALVAYLVVLDIALVNGDIIVISGK